MKQLFAEALEQRLKCDNISLTTVEKKQLLSRLEQILLTFCMVQDSLVVSHVPGQPQTLKIE